MKGDNMKVGIIGCGKLHRLDIFGIPGKSGCRIGYYDWNADRAAELAAQFGGKA